MTSINTVVFTPSNHSYTTMVSNDKIQVVLTPIPAGIIDKKLVVNVLVSFLPPLPDVNTPTTDDLKQIPLSNVKNPDQFKDWILGIIKGSALKAVSADGKQTATFIYKPTPIQTDVWNNLVIESVRRANDISKSTYPDSIGDYKRKIKNNLDDSKGNLDKANDEYSRLKKIKDNLTKLINELTSDITHVTEQEVTKLKDEANKQPVSFKKDLIHDISANSDRAGAYNSQLTDIKGRISAKGKEINRLQESYNESTIRQTRVDEIQKAETKYPEKATTNLGNFCAVTFSDLIGYLTNYPDLMKQAYLLHTFELDKSTEYFINSTGTVTITLNNLTEIDAFAKPGTRQVAYQFSQVNENTESKPWFMPALHLPGTGTPAGTAPKYIEGFLNLSQQSGYKLEQISLDPNPDKQIRYTKGFYLTVEPDSQTIAQSLPETLTLNELVVGYRVDVRRSVRQNGTIIKTGNWRSLHKRVGNIKINQSSISINDEGWISPDTRAEAREVVQLSIDGSKDSVPLNIFDLKKIQANLNDQQKPNTDKKKICLWSPSGTTCDGKYYIEWFDADSNINWKDNTTLTISLPSTIEETNKKYTTDTINSILHSTDSKNNLRFIINGFKLSCNSFGEIYYDELITADGTTIFPALKSIHSPILCCISGHSLSASTPTNTKVQKEAENYQSHVPVSNHEQGLLSALHTLVATNLLPESGSLPALRLGDDYEVRCRAVTLDGTSLQVDMELDQVKSTSYSTPKSTFLRQEVISAPIFLYAEDPALFPDDYRGASEYVIVVRLPQSSSGSNHSKLYNERLIIPPSIPRQLAEWLKLMDYAENQGQNAFLPNPKKFQEITDQCMPKYEPSMNVTIDEKGKPTPAPTHATEVIPVYKWQEGTGKLPDYSTPEFKAFVALSNGERKLPYIADPLACDIVISVTNRNRKNVENKFSFAQHTAIDQYSDISNKRFLPSDEDPLKARPWQLVVHPVNKISGPPFYEFSPNLKDRIITLHVPPGVDFEFEIGFQLPDKHTLWNVLSKNGPNLFPKRKFRVIHATESPLWYPYFLDNKEQVRKDELFNQLLKSPYENKLLKNLRRNNPGDESRVWIPFAFRYKGFAADTLELMAEWQDITDKSEKKFTPMDVEALVGTSDLLKTNPNFVVNPYKKPVFDFVKNPITLPSLISKPEQDDGNDSGLTSDRIIYNDVDCKLIADFLLPSTRCQNITFQLVSQNRFRQFFNSNNIPAPDTSSEGIKKLSVIIPSSQAPLAPEIVSAQPMFAWYWPSYVNGQNKDVHLTRQGNRIRVVLKRPWYSSGLGEKLAVIIAKEGLSNSDQLKLQPFCSLWGRDATVKTDDIESFLISTDFDVPEGGLITQRCLEGDSVEGGLTINDPLFKPNRSKVDISQYDPNEFADRKDVERPFSIIAYDVLPYGDDGKTVYADIVLDNNKVKGYTPFVRLVLARYQPNSIWDEELSSVVVCDFVQIWPERTLSRTVSGNSQVIIVEVKAIRKSADDKVLTYIYATYIDKEFPQLGSDELPGSTEGPSEYTRSINFYPAKLQPDKIYRMTYGNNRFTLNSLKVEDSKRLVVWEFESFVEIRDEELINPFSNKNLRLVFGSIIYYGK